jgi:hypothetical protein
MIPFLNLKEINHQYAEKLKAACNRVIDSGWYIDGQELEKFEQNFANYCGTKFAIGVANGLDALILTLRAWKELGKLKDGDEVIVPANTYIASVLAITANHMKPVLVEPDNLHQYSETSLRNHNDSDNTPIPSSSGYVQESVAHLDHHSWQIQLKPCHGHRLRRNVQRTNLLHLVAESPVQAVHDYRPD